MITRVFLYNTSWLLAYYYCLTALPYLMATRNVVRLYSKEKLFVGRATRQRRTEETRWARYSTIFLGPSGVLLQTTISLKQWRKQKSCGRPRICRPTLRDPQAFTPGTKMPKPPPLTDGERADLITYLRQATAEGPTEGIEGYDLSKDVFFYNHVHSILEHHCGNCHGHTTPLTSIKLRGTLLETYDELFTTSGKSPLIVPGNKSRSRLMDFLDGTKHFVTLSPLEKDILGSWIDKGAPPGDGPFATRQMLVKDAGGGEIRHIYCFADADITFARVELIDQRTGITLFTDWSKVGDSRWLHWVPDHGLILPGQVSVRITLTANAQVTSKAKLDNISSIFILPTNELSEFVLGEYEKLARYERNPVKLGTDKEGTFFYFLDYPSDVRIKIYRSELNSSSLDVIEEKNVPLDRRPRGGLLVANVFNPGTTAPSFK
jgi:hypothetical protein